MDEGLSGVWVRLRVWLANRLLDLGLTRAALAVIPELEHGGGNGGAQALPLGPMGAMGEVQRGRLGLVVRRRSALPIGVTP